jgi:cell division protein FtsQ
MELSLPLLRRTPSRGRAVSGTRAGDALRRFAGNRLFVRVTLCTLLVVALLGGGWLWLRNSSLVSVRHIHITGVHGTDAVEIRTALDNAAARMTTMNFDDAALRSAVASFTVVGGLQASTSFPHTVRISVSERQPVAALLTAGQRTAVAADGTVLGPTSLSSSLPTVTGSVEPSPGARVGEAKALAAITVLGAAPAPLAHFVMRVFDGPEGLTVAMRNGLLVYFGDSTRPHAKWLSLARVLTSPSAAGALYVDIRLPERPAAGFSSASTSASSTSTPVEAQATDPTASALATSLSKAVGGSAEPSSGSSVTSGESEATSESSSSASSGAGEASSGSEESTNASPAGASTETPSTASGEQPSSSTTGG